MLTALKLLCLACLLSGCSPFTGHTSTSADSAVQHIVVVWLHDRGNEAHRQQILRASRQLEQIPGVLSVRGGSVITSDRPVVDSSFDVALVMLMQDQQTLHNYAQHPLHKRLLGEVFKPLIEHYRVYDVQ